MSEVTFYPASPSDVPEELTRAKVSYKRQAWLAMTGLLTFIVVYLALAACFGFIAYKNIVELQSGGGKFLNIVIAGIAILLTVFMVKSLFTVRKSGESGGIEVTEKEEPRLFEFLHKLADEVGAPKPYRVFLTPEVNAAVFYDLSLINLIIPTKKNLIIGLGLVNSLSLGEMKAVLAHEFGHFAQGSMAVGRWVYIAQQIIAHMVATRDWLDSLVGFLSRIDIRIAWIGWILTLVIWSIRSLMDTLFSVVIMAERALSREMELNADLVSVSVTGSDALVNALYKLQTADEAWQTALDVTGREAGKGKRINDVFDVQKKVGVAIGKVLNDESYGMVPESKHTDVSKHRVFSEQTARPPQMWSTHPANRDREDNAKNTYISAHIDERSAWLLFSNPEELRKRISFSLYNSEKVNELDKVSADEAVFERFNKISYSSRYRGAYLNRSPVRNFSSIDEILQYAELTAFTPQSIATLYPESIAEQLELARSLELEYHTLEALESGELKPSGGVIRHRGEELKKGDIQGAIEQVESERKEVAENLKAHDANCRNVHLMAAKHVGQGWHECLMGLVRLLHCVEHLSAVVGNEQALLVNTWQVITADGQIGHFEKRRMIKVCKNTQKIMREVSSVATQIILPSSIAKVTGIDDLNEQFPRFELVDVNNKNWTEWCQAASQIIENMHYCLGLLGSATLEELVNCEATVEGYIVDSITPERAPDFGSCPEEYPILLPGNEHVLQRKLDLWNRFQLAHGFAPTLLRLIVSLGIVGGTIYSGLIDLALP